MRVRIQVEVNAWALDLPDDPELRNGKVTKETLGDWVWKHGKDQLLSRLSLSVQDEQQEEKQEPNCPTAEGEEKKEPSQTEREDIPNDNHNNLQEEAKKEESEAAPAAAKGDKDVPDADNAKGCPDKDVPDADNAKESPDAAETTADPQTVPADQKSPAISAKKSQEMQHHLELIQSLQTVKKDFLERIQDCDITDILGSDEEDKDQQISELEQDPEQSEGAVAEEKPSNNNNAAFDRNPANIALRELVDSVLSWSGTDYGFLAGVEEEELKPPSPAAADTTNKSDMNDVSELDHSDIEEQFKTMKIGPHYAAVNVPLYNEDDDDDDDENDFSSDYSTDDDDNSVDSSERRRNDPLHRTPQPITTYGPVHYKDIPGSVTLMMDQLRFEPVNPLDMLHEVDDEDNSDHQHSHHHCGECSSASLEYNYMEVYWDRVEKYQLTPKTSNRNLFKLIYRRAGVAKDNNKAKTSASSSSPKRTAEVVLKMKSRAELERIAEDVKRRVVLPSKKKKNDDTPDSQNSKKKKKKRRRRKRRKQAADEEAPNLTPQQRSVMLPPSLPRRMMSERNLWNNNNIPPATATTLPSTSSHSNDSPAPRRPIRRPTMEHKLAVTTFVDDDDSYDSDSDDDDTGDVHLWAVQDLLKKCLELKRPLCFKDRKRDRRPQPTVTPSALVAASNNSNNNNQDDKATDKTAKAKPSTALLPEKWQSLIAIPIFYSSMTKLRFVFVLATTGSNADEDKDKNNVPDTDNPQQTPKKKMPEFAHKSCLEWWVPSVTTLLQDILQHKSRLEQLTSATKTVRDLQGRLTDSLRKHSDMIHGILPPMAISKLKMQPQQWKSPLQQQHFLYNQPPKPTVVPVSAGISVDDSSISGSVHSRYGLLVGGVPSLDSSSTIQTAVQTAESEFGIYRVPEATANNNNTTPTSNAATGTTAPTNKNPGRGSANKKLPERSASTQTAQQQQQQAHPSRPVPQRTNSVGNMNNAINTNPIIRGLHRQGSIKDRAGATRPIFSRMGSKRDMMMMRASSARGSALMRMDSAKRGNLIKMDSGRFGRRGIPRLDSLRSLHGSGMSVTTSGGLSIDTFEQSWRTMYMDDESMHLEDLSGTAKISALSQDVSYLTSQSNIKYINSSLIGGIKDVQALYAGQKSNVSIVVLSIVNFHQITSKLRVGPVMDMLAKLLFTVDRLCEKYRTIKVETIGHKIVIMSGLFTGDVDEEKAGEGASGRDRKAAIDALEMSKEMVSEGQTIQIPWESNDDTTKPDSNAKSPAKDPPETLQLRVGIHIGDIKYGVLGQNVPKLDCFGDDIFVALRMEQTAPDNYIRVSRVFRDLVGPAEIDWEEGTEMIDISESTSLEAFEPAIIASASPSVEESIMSHADVKATIETYTLEPPPPAITGNCGNSVTSFPSLAPWSGDFLLGSNHEPGGMLGVQLEESFVSGEFDVD